MIFSFAAFLDMFLSNNSTDDVMMCVMTVTMTLKQGIREETLERRRELECENQSVNPPLSW